MTFGERLRELRCEKGLSQKQLAKELGNRISPSAIGHWELGKRSPNIDGIIILAKYFNVSADFLLGLED